MADSFTLIFLLPHWPPVPTEQPEKPRQKNRKPFKKLKKNIRDAATLQ